MLDDSLYHFMLEAKLKPAELGSYSHTNCIMFFVFSPPVQVRDARICYEPSKPLVRMPPITESSNPTEITLPVNRRLAGRPASRRRLLQVRRRHQVPWAVGGGRLDAVRSRPRALQGHCLPGPLPRRGWRAGDL